jgi:chromosome partitioning protein
VKTLAIVNQKGGVGKTTTAVTLAAGLASLGRSVLLVDLDAQGNCADALGVPKEDGLYRFMVMGDVGAIREARPGLDLVTGDKTTVKVKKILVGESFSEYVLRSKLDALPKDYDVAILDSAPGADVLQINALIAATHFLIPVSLAHLATVGAVDVLGTVASLRKVGAFQGAWLGILPTMWDRTTNESHAQLKAMAERFGKLVWPPIPIDVKAREAPGAGQTLWEYAADCRALSGVVENGQMVGGYGRVLFRLIEELEL